MAQYTLHGMTTKKEMKESASITLDQIGKSTLRSLSATNFVYGDHFVQFSVIASDYNKVVVKYDEGQDLYDIEHWNIDLNGFSPRFGETILVREYKGVYNDELSGLVGDETRKEMREMGIEVS